MASKRDRDSSGSSSSGPPSKRPMTQFEPVKIGPIYSLVRRNGLHECCMFWFIDNLYGCAVYIIKLYLPDEFSDANF